MKFTQLRNATVVLEIGDQCILIDPMLAPKGAIPSLRYLRNKRLRNPLVDLPDDSDEILSRVTCALITHCQKGHFDHLDRRGTKFLRERNIPVYCSSEDADYLNKRGLKVIELDTSGSNPFLGGSIQLIPCLHGKGLVGKLMAHGHGFFITIPDEPSIYLSGDTILTDAIRSFIAEHQPEYVVIPAGGAQFDLGGEIIIGLEEALEVGQISTGKVIANHLEALDHCPTKRSSLRENIKTRNWDNRFFIPEDGESLHLTSISPSL